MDPLVRLTPTARTVASAAAGLAALALWAPAAANATAHPTATYEVTSYGAKGDGKASDTSAINKAITAANSAGGGTVHFPSGTYLSASIHLRSHVILNLDSGATIKAASSGFDAAESNSYDKYQDFGHSHFHDALLWGENLTDIGFTGSGTIDGGGHLKTGSISSGQADKAFSIKVCDGLTFSGITIKRGGHFGILMNGCDHVALDHLTVSTASDRDGVNVINTSNITVTNSNIQSSDDALVFKSDYALGRTYPSDHIDVSDTTVGSTGNNALQFGSETCGDFSDAHFSRVKITAAGKAGIGIVSMDGAHISNVSYTDITMTHATTPIFMKIGTRGRCPGSPGVGSISGVTLTNVTGTNLVQGGNEYTSTIAGRPGHPVSDVTLTDVNLTVPGGHPASDATKVPPQAPTDYTPKSFGTRPSYGWWLWNASGVTFADSSVRYDKTDNRPAFQSTDSATVKLDTVVAQRGSGSPYDVGFTGVTGSSVTNCTNTSGGALRVKNTS
jgi:polygalacturonase